MESAAYPFTQARLGQESYEAAGEGPEAPWDWRAALLVDEVPNRPGAQRTSVQAHRVRQALERIVHQHAKPVVKVRHGGRTRAGVLPLARRQAGLEPLPVLRGEGRRGPGLLVDDLGELLMLGRWWSSWLDDRLRRGLDRQGRRRGRCASVHGAGDEDRAEVASKKIRAGVDAE